MKVNLGSGKNYLKGYINIDINPMWKPDIIADITKGIPYSSCSEDCEEILAHDVLEHVSDLVSTMTNCLNMLKVGGTMDISVPYYLSLGAWQDPTHVRAFCENSWLYYTDWFWYLGWRTHRFEVVELEYVVSPYGQALLELPMDGIMKEIFGSTIFHIPKAVDSMRVILRKIALTPGDHRTAEAYYGVHH